MKRNEGRMGIKEKIRKEMDTAKFYKQYKQNVWPVGPMRSDGVRRVTPSSRFCNYSTAAITDERGRRKWLT